MPERENRRTPSNRSLIRRMIRLVEREVAQLEKHYDALEAAPPADEPPAPAAPHHPRRRR